MKMSVFRQQFESEALVPAIMDRFLGRREDQINVREGEVFWDDFINESHGTQFVRIRDLASGARHISEYFLTISAVWDTAVDAPDDINAGLLDKFMGDAEWTRDRNPFWTIYKPYLQPLIQNSIMNWMVSRSLETETDREALQHAYDARLRCVDLWPMLVYLFWEEIQDDAWPVVHGRAIKQWHQAAIAMRPVMNYRSQDDWVKRQLKKNKGA